MSVLEARQAKQELMDTAARLVDELDDVPPGRVLRCFSRAVGQLRRDGCRIDRLAPEAEWLAREMLADRIHDGLEVPAPRTHSG